MEDTYPPCPECGSEFTYPDGPLFVCPECTHEWSTNKPESAAPPVEEEPDDTVRDSVGNILEDGDTVIVAQTLQVKGAPGPLKAGTKVKNIRLVEGDHDIDCKIPGFGAMKLKSSVVKKA